MNLKKYYINGHSEIYFKLGKKSIRILPHMMWNDLMLKITKRTTAPYVIDKKYDVVYYPYRPGTEQSYEKIESWYERKSIFGNKIQYTRSTFVAGYKN